MPHRSPPGPPGHWLLGNLREIKQDAMAFFERLPREYGDVVFYRLGRFPRVLVSSPELIEQVLVTDNRKYVKHYAARLLKPTLGNGLLISSGDEWLRQRRLVQPAFHRKRVESYGQVMVEHTERMLSQWRDGEVRDVHADMMQLALSIVSKILLDVDAGNYAADVASSIEVLMEDFRRRLRSVISQPEWLPTPLNLRRKRAIRRLKQIIEEIIQQRRMETEDRGDLLGALMRARDENDRTGMTDRQLRDEVMTMFLAGHETTANAMAWTWYLLATHPHVEERLRSELDGVLQGRAPTVEDATRLPYAWRVLQESMRVYPPVFIIGRESLEPVHLGGYEIPRGTTVVVSQWVMHRSSRYFEDPTEFRPERWTPEFEERLPRYAYFPFGGGPRVCVGNHFAMLEALMILATVLPRYRFTMASNEPVIPRPSVTLRPQDGVHCRLERMSVLRDRKQPSIRESHV